MSKLQEITATQLEVCNTTISKSILQQNEELRQLLDLVTTQCQRLDSVEEDNKELKALEAKQAALEAKQTAMQTAMEEKQTAMTAMENKQTAMTEMELNHFAMQNALSLAIQTTNEATLAIINQLIFQMDQANRMIAQNMLAIVRLEIAMSGDAIINAILAVKRLKTGSGTAAVVITVTGTLVMIAGNVLTGGGMSVLGGILAAAGTGVTALATNDVEGVLMATMAVGMQARVAQQEAAKGTSATDIVKGDGFNLKQDKAPEGASKFQKRADVLNAAVAGGIGLKKQLLGEGETETKSNESSFKRTYQRTAFVPHGAGGTSAITYDVQQALVNAYIEVTSKLSNELSSIAAAAATAAIATPLLTEIAILPLAANTKNSLHPLTKAVLITALNNLKQGSISTAVVGGAPATKANYEDPTHQGYVVDARRSVTSMFQTNVPLPTVAQGYSKLCALCQDNQPLPDGNSLISLLNP
jgi:hypothetical protein